MQPPLAVDTSICLLDHTPPGKDPDSHCLMLRRYHRLLWSKPLPSGHPWDLEELPGFPCRLRHQSDLGLFELSSDAVVPDWRSWRFSQSYVAQIAEEMHAFIRLGYTIGGLLIYPSNTYGAWTGRKMTINGIMGVSAYVHDRLDIRLECIRRHYAGLPSPVATTLERYAGFFRLFETFEGYLEHFLLQDFADSERVRFLLPFNNFQSHAHVPSTNTEHLQYIREMSELVRLRNQRIDAWQNPGVRESPRVGSANAIQAPATPLAHTRSN